MTDGAADVENPGEAVLTSTTIANLDYAAEMKLNREQIRSKNKESLLEIVNNTTIDESLKAGCRQQDDRHDGYCRAGGSCGNAAGGKGIFRCGGEHHGDNCDVVLNMEEVTDAKRAQVEDIVKRKTNIAADKIVITPIVVDESGE